VVMEVRNTRRDRANVVVKSRSNYEHLARSAFSGGLNAPFGRVCMRVCVRKEAQKHFLVGRRSNTEVVKEPRNFVELRIAPLPVAVADDT